MSVSFQSISEVFAALSEEQACSLLSCLDRGMALWMATKDAEPKEVEVEEVVAVTPLKKAKGKAEPKAPGAPKKEKATVSSPGAPDAAHYRIAEVAEGCCVARDLKPKDSEDKRWAPSVWYEKQCGKAIDTEGSDLCVACMAKEAHYDERIAAGETITQKVAQWAGRVGEEPLDFLHMLGTAWAQSKKTHVFTASVSAASASASASVSAASVSAASVSVASVPVAAPKKVTKAAAAKAEKEAAKAEKAAAKAEKEAAKAEKAAKVPAPKKLQAKVAVAVAASEATETAAEAEPGFVVCVGESFYFIKDESKAYVYNEVTQVIGAYAGRHNSDEETIDASVAE